MDKVLEALSKLLPADKVKDVASAVEGYLGEAKSEIESEFNVKLEEAYETLSSELKDAEITAEQGYQEAWAIIADMRNRLDVQNKEFESALEEGYEEAYQMLLAERGKNENLETELYEEYDKKLAEMKEYMIDKLDEFLQVKGKEIYEQARRDVTNDPRMAEHKVTLSKIVDTVADYITDDEFSAANSTKIEQSIKECDELRGQMKILEARNIRVSMENNKLNEQVRKQSEVIQEHTQVVTESEKKERTKKAENVQGRGRKSTEVEVIAEHSNDNSNKSEETDNGSVGVNSDSFNEWKVLSGIKK